MDWATLLEWFSHPLVTAAIGAILGLIVGWFSFRRQVNWEAMKEHFNDLKAKVVDPLLKSLDEPQKLEEVDKELYNDFQWHYPELAASLDSYRTNAQQAVELERRLIEGICIALEDSLKRIGKRYQREFDRKSNVVFTGSFSRKIFESSSHKESSVVKVAFESSKPVTAPRYSLKIEDNILYYTADMSEAGEMRKNLQTIATTFSVDSVPKEQLQKLLDLQKATENCRISCENNLRALRVKTKLRMKRKFGLFPQSCKCLKA